MYLNDIGKYGLSRDDKGYLHNSFGDIWGYERVSTTDQHLTRQDHMMEEYGVDPSHIFKEKASGKNMNRPEFRKLIRILRQGDLLVIPSLDRLGRNYDDIIECYKMIVNDIGASIHVIDMPILNTSPDPNDLFSKFITDMILQVLAFVAEQERRATLERQRKALVAMMEKGDCKYYGGRPRATIDYRFWELYIVWRSKLVPSRELISIAKDECGVAERTFYRIMRELDSRFGDIPADKLDEYIMDDYKETGFEYDTERFEAHMGIYNSYRSNPPKDRERRLKNKLNPVADDRLSEEEVKARKAKNLKRRQDEFRRKFGLIDGRTGELSHPIKLRPKKRGNDVTRTIIVD